MKWWSKDFHESKKLIFGLFLFGNINILLFSALFSLEIDSLLSVVWKRTNGVIWNHSSELFFFVGYVLEGIVLYFLASSVFKDSSTPLSKQFLFSLPVSRQRIFWEKCFFLFSVVMLLFLFQKTLVWLSIFYSNQSIASEQLRWEMILPFWGLEWFADLFLLSLVVFLLQWGSFRWFFFFIYFVVAFLFFKNLEWSHWFAFWVVDFSGGQLSFAKEALVVHVGLFFLFLVGGVKKFVRNKDQGFQGIPFVKKVPLKRGRSLVVLLFLGVFIFLGVYYNPFQGKIRRYSTRHFDWIVQQRHLNKMPHWTKTTDLLYEKWVRLFQVKSPSRIVVNGLLESSHLGGFASGKWRFQIALHQTSKKDFLRIFRHELLHSFMFEKLGYKQMLPRLWMEGFAEYWSMPFATPRRFSALDEAVWNWKQRGWTLPEMWKSITFQQEEALLYPVGFLLASTWIETCGRARFFKWLDWLRENAKKDVKKVVSDWFWKLGMEKVGCPYASYQKKLNFGIEERWKKSRLASIPWLKGNKISQNSIQTEPFLPFSGVVELQVQARKNGVIHRLEISSQKKIEEKEQAVFLLPERFQSKMHQFRLCALHREFLPFRGCSAWQEP